MTLTSFWVILRRFTCSNFQRKHKNLVDPKQTVIMFSMYPLLPAHTWARESIELWGSNYVVIWAAEILTIHNRVCVGSKLVHKRFEVSRNHLFVIVFSRNSKNRNGRSIGNYICSRNLHQKARHEYWVVVTLCTDPYTYTLSSKWFIE